MFGYGFTTNGSGSIFLVCKQLVKSITSFLLNYLILSSNVDSFSIKLFVKSNIFIIKLIWLNFFFLLILTDFHTKFFYFNMLSFHNLTYVSASGALKKIIPLIFLCFFNPIFTIYY